MAKAKIYKALMVVDKTHRKVAVEAKKRSITIDKYINDLMKLSK